MNAQELLELKEFCEDKLKVNEQLKGRLQALKEQVLEKYECDVDQLGKVKNKISKNLDILQEKLDKGLAKIEQIMTENGIEID